MEELIIILLCLLLNALFAAYEMAFVSMPRSELRDLAKSGHKNARRLLGLKESPERTLSIIQVGITLVGAIAAAIGGAGAGESLEPYFIEHYQLGKHSAEALAVIIVVIPYTYLSVVVGELVPKTLALRNPSKIILAGAPFLFIMDRLLSPVVTVLEKSTKVILKIFFKRPKHKQAEASEGDSNISIGSLSPTHQKYMFNMAGIEKKRLQDILLPWSRVVYANKNDSIEKITHIVLQSGHTRLPICEDHKVIGLLHTKEFIALKESGEKDWQKIIRPALYMYAHDSALSAIRRIQNQRTHLAIVLDTQGRKVGIVTLEDIIEEVVGDFFDEDDDGRVRQIYAIKSRNRTALKE